MRVDNTHIVRALYDESCVTIYQAYNGVIAESAVKNQTFISPPFKLDRMTWIKPSFLWMMYRSGWASKPSQEHILSIKITRRGFDWALQNACLSHFDKEIHASEEVWKEQLQNAPVRIQWDPERDIHNNRLEQRAIQIGLSGEAVSKYINDWIVSITDITEKVRLIDNARLNDELHDVRNLIPREEIYCHP